MLLYYLSLIESQEDQSKFEKIYNSHRKLMLFVARRVLKEPQLAEDAVQNAFIKIIHNLNRIDDLNCHKTKHFIVIITKNAAIDLMRKEKRQRYFCEEDMSKYNDSSSIDLTAFEMEYIIDKIEQLKPIYRDILQLKIQFDLSDRQIAVLLDISYETVRKRLERSRKLLTELLNDEEVAHV